MSQGAPYTFHNVNFYLPVNAVTTGGNQNALSQFLRNAAAVLAIGDTAEARLQLGQAANRTDGCALRGTPDGNGPGRDWITTCAQQAPIYQAIIAALAALS